MSRAVSIASALNEEHARPTRDQKQRLDALERLCSQGTFSPAECQGKRQAILRGGS
jgi:hypothetical protein